MRQAQVLDAQPDAVIAPVGGGGLLSGVAIAVKAASPATSVYGVEPRRVRRYAGDRCNAANA